MGQMLSEDGFPFFVDDELEKLVRCFKWKSMKKGTESRYFYTYIGGRLVYLHRLVMAISGNFVVDHKDRDPSNNRGENLDATTQSGNIFNAGRKRKISKYRGIYRRRDKWFACIAKLGVRHRSGPQKTQEDAARAYDVLAKQHSGGKAILNFPEDE